MSAQRDADLQAYRDLIKPPTEFKEGFAWSTVAGIIFCGIVMLPGSIYLGLMTGGTMGPAATWVTLILFAEMSRRAMKTMNTQELVVLLRAATIIMAASALFPGGPIGGLVYRAYLVTSDAVRDAGLANAFPSWFVPAADSPAIANRELFHIDWAVPLGLLAFSILVDVVNRYTLGYFFFRVTSDVEKLPYPMAPIQAQGAMALAESDNRPAKDSAGQTAKTEIKPMAPLTPGGGGSPRWKQFSLGATLGLAFGAIQVGIPAITGLFLDKPVFLLPQPFVDLTTLTQGLIPATPFGFAIDLGIVMMGLVLPFWVVLGTFLAVVATMIANPALHAAGMLPSWQPGMDTINTTFANEVDFWMSFNIGAGLAVAAVSIFGTIRDVRAKMREIRERKAAAGTDGPVIDLWKTPPGRGDYPLWIALVGYLVASGALVGVCWYLLPKDLSILLFLLAFAFVYSPFISYVNARLMGISGQSVDIPFVRETAFLASGAKGVDIWLAPIPVTNQGGQAQALRVNELTGVRFWSLIKTEMIALPILFVLSMVFWAFIWKANAIPSPAFPAAEVGWALQAKRDALLYTSTHTVAGSETSIMDSQFMKAIHPGVIVAGFLGIVGLFGGLSLAGAPVLLGYGIVRGIGQLPHSFIFEIIGAVAARYWFEKTIGRDEFRLMAPTLLAGYFTGVGLIGMGTIAMKLIQQAVSGVGL
jgi:hypothetical protein